MTLFERAEDIARRQREKWDSSEAQVTLPDWRWTVGKDEKGIGAVCLYAHLNRVKCQLAAEEHGYRDLDEGTIAEAARAILEAYDPEYFPGTLDDFRPPAALREEEAERKRIEKTALISKNAYKKLEKANRPIAALTDDELAIAKMNNGNGHRQPRMIDDIQERYPLASAALDDIQDAWRLADRLNNNYLWCEIHNTWYVYDCGVWQKDNEELRIMREAKEAIVEWERDAYERKDEDAFKHYRSISKNINRVKRILESMKSVSNVFVSLLDNNDVLLNCRNGTLNLDTMEFHEFKRDEYHTKQVNADYKKDEPTPEIFLTFINDIFQGNEELIRYVQKVLGYSLGGGTGEQEFYIFWGDGNNGKSQLIKCFSMLTDSYAHNMSAEKIMVNKYTNNDTYIAQLKKIRALFCSESAQAKTLDSDLIKVLTGGEPITVAQKYERPETFEISAKVFLITNNKPTIRDTTEGIWRRIRLIPFEYTVPVKKRIKDFGNLLYKSGPSGILNWLLEGYRLYKEEGLEAPEIVRASDEEYRSEEDIILQFLTAKCLRIEQAHISLESIYQEFHKFTSDMNLHWSKKRLSKELRSKKFTIEHGRTGQIVNGIAWREEQYIEVGDKPSDVPF